VLPRAALLSASNFCTPVMCSHDVLEPWLLLPGSRLVPPLCSWLCLHWCCMCPCVGTTCAAHLPYRFRIPPPAPPSAHPPTRPPNPSGYRDMCAASAAAGDCLFSEPTSIGTEMPVWEGKGVPRVRLDFVLLGQGATAALPSLACRMVQDNVTQVLSDHFPILCEAGL
jgi:hypothetical protein